MSEEDKERIFKNIASLVLAGIGMDEVAKILELDLEKLKQVVELEDYKNVQQLMLMDRVKREQTFNDSWDGIEENAMRVVGIALRNSRDGEYALRAAMVANKARRRGVNSNAAIGAAQSMRATVALPVKFVTKLQNRNGEITLSAEVSQDDRPKEPQQRIDCLMPAGVENLFGTKQIAKQQVIDEDMLGGIF